MKAEAKKKLTETMDRLMRIGFDDVVEQGGKVWLVGGFVRDAMLGRESKDIDVVIDRLPMNGIFDILERRGKVDIVGKSFAVLKFAVDDETIDVAVPRKDIHDGSGTHRGVAVSTEGVGMYEDMLRRDFTINAMAFNGDLFDITGGEYDIFNKVIRCVDEAVFAEDPLRLLRAVVFSARFGFEISGDTMKLLKDNVGLIKNEPGERIMSELEKILDHGGDIGMLVNTLMETHMYGEMFRSYACRPYSGESVEGMTRADFFYSVLSNAMDPKRLFLTYMRGDTVTAKEIDMLTSISLYEQFADGKRQSRRHTAQIALDGAPGLLHSKVMMSKYPDVMPDFVSGRYPKNRLDLAVNGHDLMEIGVKNIDIAFVQNKLLDMILSDALSNERKELLNAAKTIIR